MSLRARTREAGRRAVNRLPDAVPRLRFYEDVWSALRPLRDQEKRQHLDALAAWVGQPPTLRDTHRTMRSAEVRQLAATAGMDVGAHTVTHAHLPSCSIEEQRSEIRDSHIALETVLGRKVQTFSYPFGANTAETRALAQADGFLGAVGVQSIAVDRSSDLFEVPRFDVKDWSSVEFTKQIEEWFAH